MTPQSSLTVAAPVDRKSVPDLRALLSTMNLAPGQANAANPLVPFGQLENLHFARFVVLGDPTLDDVRLYGLPRQEYPICLVFLCDFDGSLTEFLGDLRTCAESGLRRIFSFCADFGNDTDLIQWIKNHNIPVAASYVNWRGRTTKQVREESKLRDVVGTYLRSGAGTLMDRPPEQIRTHLRKFVEAEIAAGRLALTPPAPTPWH